MGRFVVAAASVAAGLVLGWTGAAAAQDVRALAADATAAPGALADLKGMQGGWVAKDATAGFSAPAGGEMIGHLLLLTDAGGIRVQEFWVVRPEGASLVLRQKHFTGDLKQREDKDQWAERRLAGHDAGHIYFDNLTLVTKGDTMDLLVRIPGANGAAPTLLTYNFRRVK